MTLMAGRKEMKSDGEGSCGLFQLEYWVGACLEVYPLEALSEAPVQIWSSTASILNSPLVVKRRPHRYLSFNPCMQNKCASNGAHCTSHFRSPVIARLNGTPSEPIISREYHLLD